MKRIPLLACLLLAAWPLLFFWQFASGQQVLFFGDTAQFWYPTHVAYANALRAGHLPLWAPEIFGGFPLYAEMQIGALYPPHLVLYGLLPTELAMNYDILLHLAWMGIGMFLLARRSRMSEAGALFAAFVYAAGGMTQARVAHVNVLLIMAWLPWALYFYERWRAARGTRHIIALVLALTFIILIGHPQFAALAFLIFAAWVIVNPNGDRNWLILRINSFVALLALVAAVGLAAVQLVPTYELAQLAARTTDAPGTFTTSFSLHPLRTVYLLLPFFSGNPYPNVSVEVIAYTGLFPLALLGASLFVDRNRLTMFGLVVAAISIFLAFGGYNPIYRVLAERVLPSVFRAPSRFLLLFYFVTPLVAGGTMDRLVQRLPDAGLTRGVKTTIALFIIVLAIVIGAGPNVPLDVWLGLWQFLPVALMAVAGILGFLIWRKRIARGLALVLVIGVTALDLAAFGEVYLHLYNSGVPRDLLSSRPRVLDVVDAPTGEARVYTSRWIYPWVTAMRESLYPDIAFAYRTTSAQGYTPLVPYYVQSYLTALSPENESDLRGRVPPADPCVAIYRQPVSSGGMLNALNVRYYLIPQLPSATPACEAADVHDPYTPNPVNGTLAIAPTKVDKLIIDSSLAQSVNYRDGDVVAEVQITLSGDETITRSLRAGLETAEWAYDRSDVRAQVKHSRAPIASTFPARSAIPVEAHDGHVFRGEFALGGITVTAIRITPKMNADLFHLAGISYVAGGQTTNLARLVNASDHRIVYRSEDVAAFENEDAMPRAWLAHHVQIGSDGIALSRMTQADWNPRAETFVTEGEALDDTADNAEQESAKVVEYLDMRVVVDVRANSDAYLVLSESWYPGWVARVDGVEEPIRRADVMLRAVKVNAGAHRVKFEYAPRSFQLGLWISAGATLVCLGALAVTQMRRRLN